jgi:hypothetical protein
MAALVIEPPLAEQIRAIAENEHRPIEAVLSDMLETYTAQQMDIKTRLKAAGGFILPSDEPAKPPMTEEELRALAERIGAAGPLSTLVIEERKQGY